MNVRIDTASVRSQQILVYHHFTSSTSYLNAILNREGKSTLRVLQSVRAYSIQSSIRKHKACSEDIFYQLQYAKIIAPAEALARPERHTWALRTVSRVVISNSYHSREQVKLRIREDACCPHNPSSPKSMLAPRAHPLHPKPRPTYLGGTRVARSPSSSSRAGAWRGWAWLPSSPSLLAPSPLERSCRLQQGAAAQPDGERQEVKAALGPAKPATRARSGETLPSWEDCSRGPSWQLQKEIREERTGNGTAGLLARIQALLQPLLFPDSKRRIVKRRVWVPGPL